jgi:hypothetical protein
MLPKRVFGHRFAKNLYLALQQGSKKGPQQWRFTTVAYDEKKCAAFYNMCTNASNQVIIW